MLGPFALGPGRTVAVMLVVLVGMPGVRVVTGDHRDPPVDIRQGEGYSPKMTNTTTAAEHVRKCVDHLRRERGWTWRELARRTGILEKRMYNVSRSRRNYIITIDELVTFAEAFGVAPSALLPIASNESVKLNPDALVQLLLGAAVQQGGERHGH